MAAPQAVTMNYRTPRSSGRSGGGGSSVPPGYSSKNLEVIDVEGGLVQRCVPGVTILVCPGCFSRCPTRTRQFYEFNKILTLYRYPTVLSVPQLVQTAGGRWYTVCAL